MTREISSRFRAFGFPGLRCQTQSITPRRDQICSRNSQSDAARRRYKHIKRSSTESATGLHRSPINATPSTVSNGRPCARRLQIRGVCGGNGASCEGDERGRAVGKGARSIAESTLSRLLKSVDVSWPTRREIVVAQGLARFVDIYSREQTDPRTRELART